jgi:hypothetical protein
MVCYERNSGTTFLNLLKISGEIIPIAATVYKYINGSDNG